VVPPEAFSTLKQNENHRLKVSKSKLPNAGNGLFAKQSIEKGMVFCEYIGPIVGKKKKRKNGHDEVLEYGITVYSPTNEKWILDARTEAGKIVCKAAYANDGGDFSNAEFATFNDKPFRAFLQATKKIEEGDEVYVCYGEEYWGIEQYPEKNSSLQLQHKCQAPQHQVYQRQALHQVHRHTRTPMQLQIVPKPKTPQQPKNGLLTKSLRHKRAI